MKICVPVVRDEGMDSPVSGHFGSAPFYLLLDAPSGQTRTIRNARTVHEHGACRPLESLAGEEIDVVMVGGIGGGALAKLHAAGIRVVRAGAPTARECISALLRGEALEIRPADACASHAGGHTHSSVNALPVTTLPSVSTPGRR
jgi:predicted Fe-Mo cluster-binding NifX family protein